MTRSNCPHEQAVSHAARTGQWSGPLTAHVEQCADCRQATQAVSWMKRLAETSRRERPLPDPDLLWLKAKLFGEQAAADRATRPLVLTEGLAQGAVAVFAALWLAWNWPKIQTHLTGLWTRPAEISWLSETMIEASAQPLHLALASVAVAAVCLVVVFALHPILTGE